MTMGGKWPHDGFTIVETMIVLSVTATLAVSALLLISGKQNKTEFVVAINNTKQQIEQIINETASGYYPDNAGFNCVASSTNPRLWPTFNTGTNTQGTNVGCIFLGKVVQFGLASGNNQQFKTYPIVGNRLDVSGDPVTKLYDTLKGSQPIALAIGNQPHNTTSPTNGIKDLSLSQTLRGGLKIGSMTYTRTNGTPGGNTGGVGFLTDLNSYGGCSGGLCAGSQQFALFVVSGTNRNTTSKDMVDAIDKSINAGDTIDGLREASEVQICFTSGTTDQSGQVTIGGASQKLTVKLKIFDGTTCS